MSGLVLDSLKIKGYRCFNHLTIEKLGRVNLIVGQNNVGKTAFLEALWLYANNGDGSLMLDLLRARNEIPPSQNGSLVQPESNRGLRNIFYNRPNLDFLPADPPEYISDNLDFIVGENINIEGEEPEFIYNTLWVTARRSGSNDVNSFPRADVRTTHNKSINNYFIRANGLTDQKLVEFWDKIERFVLDDLVLKALKIIAPNVQDIRFSGYPSGAFSRVPVVRLERANERVPLRSLGDGMTRVLGIASALVNCENGMLLIDEIETGFHYSILPDVWKLIFKTAKDLNVQVFATTHSKDCVEAFTEAAAESPEDGMLIRLERQGENIVAKAIEEEMLIDAVNYEVEVR